MSDGIKFPFAGDIGWMGEAACRGMDTELFFDDPWAKKGILAEVQQVCYRCPVTAQCLEYALDNRLQGVWGGLKEFDRAKLISKRRN